MIQSIITTLSTLYAGISFISLSISGIVGIFIFNKLRKFSGYTTLICVIQSLFLTLVIYTILQFASPAQEIQKQQDADKMLIVGTSADFPPFSMIKDGTITGFDIDIISLIAEKLHKKIEIKDMPFTALIPQIQLGKIQVIAAGMTATPEREKRVLFTQPYLTGDPLIVITQANNPITSLLDLHDKEVVVNEGYTADTYMSAQEGPKLIRLKSPAEAFLAIKTGRSFAFVTSAISVKPFFDQHGNKEFSIYTIPAAEESTSLAISMKYPELLMPIQDILDEMKEDGTIEKLKQKWNLV
ncbi:MAG: transporter substrate-binding domain-containing protein [Candidatus Babeliales bacterium]